VSPKQSLLKGMRKFEFSYVFEECPAREVRPTKRWKLDTLATTNYLLMRSSYRRKANQQDPAQAKAKMHFLETMFSHVP